MKNGKLELFDDVMTPDGKGQVRYIESYLSAFIAFESGGYRWYYLSELTYIPKTPIMVYVSDESEDGAINYKNAKTLLHDFGPDLKPRYACKTVMGGAEVNGVSLWNYAVPVDSVEKPTITKAELQAIQDTIEKVKNGAMIVED